MGILHSPTVLFLIIARLRVHANNVENNSNQQEAENSFASSNINFQIQSVPEWPNKNIKFGQVSGVALDTYGNVYVFHRATRTWDVFTFDPNDIITEKRPIAGPTVAVIHPTSGDLLYEWGRQMFYLPHGITIDTNDNVWVTDVAMHQIFKFPPILTNSKVNNSTPLLKLGSKLQPGRGKYTFCKPTAIAVENSGKFFVSDGYCNSRVIKYDADGTFLMQWGRSSLSTSPVVPSYHFNVPHDLSLAEDKNLIYVSDRENGRIQCFMASNGTFVHQIQSPNIGSRLFSASYTSANDGLLFIVNGPSLVNTETIHGSVVSANGDSKVVTTFVPQTKAEPTFGQPHDVIVSANGTSLYVAELHPYRVWKFTIVGLHASAPVVMSRNADEKSAEKYDATTTPGTMLMAIFVTAIVLCFGAVLLTTALVYSRSRARGCSGNCKQATWRVGRSTVDGFKFGNFLSQQNQGFVKLNNFEESDEDDSNISPTTSFA